jgi:hypothetical protein
MMEKVLFAAVLGGSFGFLMAVILPFEFAMIVSFAAGFPIGWYAGEIYDYIFGGK